MFNMANHEKSPSSNPSVPSAVPSRGDPEASTPSSSSLSAPSRNEETRDSKEKEKILRMAPGVDPQIAAPSRNEETCDSKEKEKILRMAPGVDPQIIKDYSISSEKKAEQSATSKSSSDSKSKVPSWTDTSHVNSPSAKGEGKGKSNPSEVTDRPGTVRVGAITPSIEPQQGSSPAVELEAQTIDHDEAERVQELEKQVNELLQQKENQQIAVVVATGSDEKEDSEDLSQEDTSSERQGCVASLCNRYVICLIVLLLAAGGTAAGVLVSRNSDDKSSSPLNGTDSVTSCSWTQLGQDIDGEAAGDYSGRSVSLSSDGSTIGIGATHNDGNGNRAGHVRILNFNGTSWNQVGSDIDGEAPGDESGTSVSLSDDGSIVAVGGRYNDGNGFASGHVRILRLDHGNCWIQVGDDIDGEAAEDRSGRSVSLSADGTMVAIGAYKNSGSFKKWSGHTRVYAWDGNSWVQVGADIDGETAYDRSGWAVSLSADGSVVATNAYNNTGANGIYSGHTRVFRLTPGNNNWTQVGSDIDGEAAEDYLGKVSFDRSGESISLSADGTVLAVGAWGNDGNGDRAGHVRVFNFDGSTGSWIQLGSDIDGEVPGDGSGTSVSLSSDGSTLAIGAILNGGNGYWSGHTRVFKFVEKEWIQVGDDIDGERIEDESGSSVSLSADGSVVAVGARFNDGNGEDSGHTRVFQLTCS